MGKNCTIAQWNVLQGFVSLWKHRSTRWFCKFLTFSHMNSVFFQPNWLYFGLKTQLVWKKRRNSCEKMSKNGQIALSADKMNWPIFDIFSHDFSLFSTQLTLFRPKNSIGLKKRLKSCEKMSKICEIISVDRCFHNETKPCETFHCVQ